MCLDFRTLNQFPKTIWVSLSTNFELWRLVIAARRHAHELIGFNDVRRQLTTIDAAGIQPDCARGATWLLRGPVPKQYYLLPAIHFVPRDASSPRRICAHRSYFTEIVGHLTMKWNA